MKSGISKTRHGNIVTYVCVTCGSNMYIYMFLIKFPVLELYLRKEIVLE